MTEVVEYRRYRAPAESGQTLVEPTSVTLPDLVARNGQRLKAVNYDFQGRTLADLAAAARRGLAAAAIRYTREYRDAPRSVAAAGSIDTRPLIVSGHQPQLFHPGVWFKNFVLGRLANQVGGLGVHLLIDSDLCRSASIRVPTGTVDDPRVEAMPYDRHAGDIPFEERPIVDDAAIETFADRTAAMIEPFVARPVLETLWRYVLRPTHRERTLGHCLARGRHTLEAEWGNDTLELPQSAVCRLPEFHWFVAHLLAQLPRFQTAHNAALASYRRAHRLRNQAHPVPDLIELDGWLEAPFWLWTKDDPRRRGVFARQQGDQLLVTDRGLHTFALPLSADGSAESAAEQLAGLAAGGLKIRTRALATTLFARLLLCDLFIHGIGGAKYDQVTDEITSRFFNFRLPEFATATATLRLPIQHPPADIEEWRALRRQFRELRYHPERFLGADSSCLADPSSVAGALVAEKLRWVETPKTPANSRERHLAIQSANTALQSHVTAIREQLLHRIDDLERRRRVNAILDSREYSFCLYPQETLQRHLLDGTPPIP
jgi:hypothetical protein